MMMKLRPANIRNFDLTFFVLAASYDGVEQAFMPAVEATFFFLAVSGDGVEQAFMPAVEATFFFLAVSGDGVEQAFMPAVEATFFFLAVSGDGVEQAFMPAVKAIRTSASAAEVLLCRHGIMKNGLAQRTSADFGRSVPVPRRGRTQIFISNE
jgi:hypothetical protein